MTASAGMTRVNLLRYSAPMPGSYSQLLFHIVFATKNREPFIAPSLRERLYPYLGGIVRGERGTLLAIGGVADHIHLLMRWRADKALADLMRDLKSQSSLWVHETFPERRTFAWQEGYAAFSVSASAKERVVEYIVKQEEHHQARTFGEELRTLLDAHGVEYDAKYLPP